MSESKDVMSESKVVLMGNLEGSVRSWSNASRALRRGWRPHRSRIERSCGVVSAMGIVQPVRLWRRRACGERTSARHSSDVSGPIDRAKGAIQRMSCCLGCAAERLAGCLVTNAIAATLDDATEKAMQKGGWCRR